MDILDVHFNRLIEQRRHSFRSFLVDDVESAGAVVVEYGLEGARVAVEEVLVVDERVRVAELHDLLVRLGGGEEAEARARVEEQRRPQDLSRWIG